MSKNPVVIFGTGEIARLAHYYFTHDSNYEIVAFCCDDRVHQVDGAQLEPDRGFLRHVTTRRVSLVTSSDVFDESATLIRYRLGHRAAVAFGEKLQCSTLCRLIDVTNPMRTAGWDLFVRYHDQEFSLTDCTSFALMRSMDLVDAFTFDRRVRNRYHGAVNPTGR